MSEDGNAFVADSNPFRQRVNVEYLGQQLITTAYLSDIMGRTEQVELSAPPLAATPSTSPHAPKPPISSPSWPKTAAATP